MPKQKENYLPAQLTQNTTFAMARHSWESCEELLHISGWVVLIQPLILQVFNIVDQDDQYVCLKTCCQLIRSHLCFLGFGGIVEDLGKISVVVNCGLVTQYRPGARLLCLNQSWIRC